MKKGYDVDTTASLVVLAFSDVFGSCPRQENGRFRALCRLELQGLRGFGFRVRVSDVELEGHDSRCSEACMVKHRENLEAAGA